MTPSQPADARTFPADFLFGAATAAFQIEGANTEDGRTDSIWDAFCRVPGAVINGDDGSVACDHYHRYRDDVALMADLGLQSYRFSTSWARIQPDGGPVNPAGLDFYSRLVDELLGRGIKPWLTLYHWDLPQALEETGGWRNRDTAYRFRDYAMAVHDALGDRVPAVDHAERAVVRRVRRPLSPVLTRRVTRTRRRRLAAVHHLLLGHGLAVQALRAAAPQLDLGITLNLTVANLRTPDGPATSTPRGGSTGR